MSGFGHQRGFTLIELLISISLIAIMAAATTVASFPSAEELSQKSPDVAISGITRKARNLAHLYGKNVCAHIYIGEPKVNNGSYKGINFEFKDKNFSDIKNIKNSAQLESLKNLLLAIRREDVRIETDDEMNSLIALGILNNNQHKTFIILEEEDGQLLFDGENQLQYVVLNENSMTDEIFEIHGKTNGRTLPQQKITIYPNGLNDVADINFTRSGTGKSAVYSYQGKINSFGKVTNA